MGRDMRRWLSFAVEGAACAASLDEAEGRHGLLIVSGGNEIRSGAHRGMARLAADMAELGHPVLRYDRRGTGDSEGDNLGFEGSGPDIAAAATALRAACPHVETVTAFGNCDAAAALALFHGGAAIDALLLSNPWTVDDVAGEEETTAETAEPALPPASAIRARYLAKLAQPAEWRRLLSGGVNLSKLARGMTAALRPATPPTAPDGLAARMTASLADSAVPTTILVAEGDRTAQLFLEHWAGEAFRPLHGRVPLHRYASPSHSYADAAAWDWLTGEVSAALSN